jgi:ribonuclease HII
MRRAVEQLAQQPDFLLVDGYAKTLHPTIPHESVIKGDQKSFSIAAASILAKVHRDNFMITLGKQHPEYGFESHKGYGSKQHQEALRNYGALPCHRAAYAPIQAII